MNYTDGFEFMMGKMAAEFTASLIPLGIFMAGWTALVVYVWWLGWREKREKKKAEQAQKRGKGGAHGTEPAH